jgi:hypothetical protein
MRFVGYVKPGGRDPRDRTMGAVIGDRVTPLAAIDETGGRHPDSDARWRRDRPQSPSLHEAGRFAHHSDRRAWQHHQQDRRQRAS